MIEKQTSELIPYARNPRINDAAVDGVAASIKEFGFKVPIIIDAENVIVCGHTRLKAAQKLGLKVVPCIVADDLTPSQIKALRVAENRSHEASVWNEEMLIDEINQSGYSLDFFSFELSDFAEREVVMQEWDLSETHDETVITIRGKLVDQAEIRKRLKDIDGIEIKAAHIVI